MNISLFDVEFISGLREYKIYIIFVINATPGIVDVDKIQYSTDVNPRDICITIKDDGEISGIKYFVGASDHSSNLTSFLVTRKP